MAVAENCAFLQVIKQLPAAALKGLTFLRKPFCAEAFPPTESEWNNELFLVCTLKLVPGPPGNFSVGMKLPYLGICSGWGFSQQHSSN